VVLVGCAFLATPASAYIYWTTGNYDTVGRAYLDGAGVDQHFITDANDATSLVLGANGEWVYWLNAGADGGNGAIARAQVDGKDVQQDFISPVRDPRPSGGSGSLVVTTDDAQFGSGLAADQAHLYWGLSDLDVLWSWSGSNTTGAPTGWNPGAAHTAEDVSRANLDGSGAEMGFDTLEDPGVWNNYESYTTDPPPRAIAADGRYVFWVNPFNHTIGRVDADGSKTETLISHLPNANGLAVADPYLYWTNSNGTIGRATVDGKTIDNSFIAGAHHPTAIAVNAGYVYWINDNGTIGRARLDGTDIDERFVTGAFYAVGLAVNSDGPRPKPIHAPPATITHVVGPIPTPPPATSPTNTAPPTISGTPEEGQTLAAATGSWTGTPPLHYSYQWRRCTISGTGCSAIPGQTGPTYSLFAPDSGARLDVVVTVENVAGSNSATSAPTSTIQAPPPPPTPSTTTSTTTTSSTVTVTLGSPSEFGIRLSTPTVPAGTVTFEITNAASSILAHSFKICSSNLGGDANHCAGTGTTPLSPGNSTTLSIDLGSPGTYEYLSTVPGDAAAGMKGDLKIT
jgi:uncharacterized cupredoxin-like copper-binding protein